MTYYLDYSARKISGTSIKAAGYAGVIRYIDAPNKLATKHTNLAEYNDHIANGLTVLLVKQNTTTDADGGWAFGVKSATDAKAGADYLGYRGPIFFTNDRTTVPNPAAWRAYLDGAASVLGIERVGAYGFANAMDTAQGHAEYFWQSGRRADVRSFVNFWQDNNTQVTVAGTLCDRNLVLKPISFGDEDMADIYNDLVYNWNGENISVEREFAGLYGRLLNLHNELLEAQPDGTFKLKDLSTGGVDLDALAQKVSDKLLPLVADSVADELQRRLTA